MRILKDKNQIAVSDFLFLCASVDNTYDIGGKQYGKKTLHYIQGGRIPFLSRMRIMKDKNHVAVGDFIFLCASVDNTYDIGGKQYGRKTIHYIQGGRIPFLPRMRILKDKNQIAVSDFLFLCASVDNTYDIGGKQYGRKTLHYIQGGRIPFLPRM